MRLIARGLIEDIVPRHECDVLDDFARLFPTTVFMRMMGLPEDDLDRFLAWNDTILHPTLDDDPPAKPGR